jgi:hypothetical protein
MQHMHQCGDNPRAIRVVYARPFDHQTPPFEVMFERSWHSLKDGATYGSEALLVWRRRPFIFFLSSSLSHL